MTAANDIEARCDEIRQLVGIDEIPQAIKRAMDFARDFCQELRNQSIVISASWHDLNKRRQRGELDDIAFSRQRKALLNDLLDLLDSVITKLCAKAA